MKKETIDVAAVAAELGRLHVSEGYDVADLAKRLATLDPEVCEYKKGEVMLRERERATRIGVILEGAVHIRYSGMEGKSVLLHMYVAGSFVGLSSVVMEQRCAEEGTKTVVVPGTEADFADYLGVHVVALSRALSRMKAVCLIAYRRNVLTLRM